jgi:uncharacterized protein
MTFPPPDPSDCELVTQLLGREPSGSFRVVVRDDAGVPVVIENAPFLASGRPMPTQFWLVGREHVRAVSRLESSGGVRAAEAALDPGAIRSTHEAAADERRRWIDGFFDPAGPGQSSDPPRPTPSGGVGGTRRGVKCLHAHYARFLAGRVDVVGEWVHDQLAGTSESGQGVEQTSDDSQELR